MGVAAGQPSSLRHHHGEAPAVTTAVPLALALPADGSIEADIGGNNALVVERALAPGLHVLQDPFLVLLLAGEGVGIEAQRCGHQILRMVPHDIGVILEVRQHLVEIALPMQGNKALLDLVEGIAGPI